MSFFLTNTKNSRVSEDCLARHSDAEPELSWTDVMLNEMQCTAANVTTTVFKQIHKERPNGQNREEQKQITRKHVRSEHEQISTSTLIVVIRFERWVLHFGFAFRRWRARTRVQRPFGALHCFNDETNVVVVAGGQTRVLRLEHAYGVDERSQEHTITVAGQRSPKQVRLDFGASGQDDVASVGFR